jgi:hypothetical protein
MVLFFMLHVEPYYITIILLYYTQNTGTRYTSIYYWNIKLLKESIKLELDTGACKKLRKIIDINKYFQ